MRETYKIGSSNMWKE